MASAPARQHPRRRHDDLQQHGDRRRVLRRIRRGCICRAGLPWLFANIITGNGAFFGGGIAALESSPTIVQNLIGCKTHQNVAAVDSTSDGKGGGVYFWFADGILDEDTIVGNEASGPPARVVGSGRTRPTSF